MDELREQTVVRSETESFDVFYPRAATACEAVLRRSYARLCLAVLSSSELEDAIHSAIQDALEKAHRLWDKYDETRASRMTWVVCMARNYFVRQVNQNRQHVLHRASDRAAVEIAAPEETVRVENAQTVVALFDRMAPTQAEALRLRYLNDMSLRQVADHMRTTVAAVQSILQRGKDSARRRLTEEGEPRERQAL